MLQSYLEFSTPMVSLKPSSPCHLRLGAYSHSTIGSKFFLNCIWIKLMYSEKTTKFDEISRFYLKFLSSVKKMEILSFFVAFPEYPSQNIWTLSINLELHEVFMVFCFWYNEVSEGFQKSIGKCDFGIFWLHFASSTCRRPFSDSKRMGLSSN